MSVTGDGFPSSELVAGRRTAELSRPAVRLANPAAAAPGLVGGIRIRPYTRSMAAPHPLPPTGADPEGPPGGEGEPHATPERGVQASAWRWIRAAAIVVTLYVSYQLLLLIGGLMGIVASVVLYAVFGIVVALVAQPAVSGLERRLRLPRSLAIVGVLGGAVAVVVLLGLALAGPLAAEAKDFFDNDLPRIVSASNSALAGVQYQLAQRGIHLNIGNIPANAANSISGNVASVLVSGVYGTLLGIVDVVIVLVVAFWVLRDGEDLRAGFIALLPGRLRAEVDFGFDAFSAVVGSYVRAQLALAILIGIAAGLGCALIGVPSPLVVGIAAGVFELIPIVGPFVGGGVALILAAAAGTVTVVLTVVLFIAIHVAEAYILSPRIQGRFVRLHPVVALLALLAGIEAGGFIGAFLAVPAASLVAVFIRAAVGDWRASRPELFAVPAENVHLERRRRRLLREFRLFRRGDPPGDGT